MFNPAPHTDGSHLTDGTISPPNTHGSSSAGLQVEDVASASISVQAQMQAEFAGMMQATREQLSQLGRDVQTLHGQLEGVTHGISKLGHTGSSRDDSVLASAGVGEGLGVLKMLTTAQDQAVAQGGISEESEPRGMAGGREVDSRVGQGTGGWSNSQAGALALTATLIGGALVALLQGGQSGGR